MTEKELAQQDADKRWQQRLETERKQVEEQQKEEKAILETRIKELETIEESMQKRMREVEFMEEYSDEEMPEKKRRIASESDAESQE